MVPWILVKRKSYAYVLTEIAKPIIITPTLGGLGGQGDALSGRVALFHWLTDTETESASAREMC